MLSAPLAQLTHLVLQAPHAWAAMEADAQRSLVLVARLLYMYTKVRGYKVVMKFLPHEVHHLPPLLRLLESLAEAPGVAWEVPYILLLWLSVAALVPFALDRGGASTDDSLVARAEAVACVYLSSPGKERDAACTVLGELYRRDDAAGPRLGGFLAWAQAQVHPGQSPFVMVGLLQTCCAVVKSSDAPLVERHYGTITALLAEFRDCAAPSMLIDRYRIKLTSRLAQALLASSAARTDVDERVDDPIGELLDALSHADSRVRYSAAKGLARVCAWLDEAYASQIMEALLDQLTDHVLPGDVPPSTLAAAPLTQFAWKDCIALRRVNLHAVSEATWHGVHLALAECVRRRLVPRRWMSRVLYWVLTVGAAAYDRDSCLTCGASPGRPARACGMRAATCCGHLRGCTTSTCLRLWPSPWRSAWLSPPCWTAMCRSAVPPVPRCRSGSGARRMCRTASRYCATPTLVRWAACGTPTVCVP